MAKTAGARGRKRRGSTAKGKGGMAPWYGAAVLLVAGIVVYDHRDELSRYLPAARTPATVSSRQEAAKPQPAPRPGLNKGVPSAKPGVGLADRHGNTAGGAALVPPAPIPSPITAPATTPAAPQPAARPMLASLPPPTIAVTPAAKATAPDGGARMVGAGFKGKFYYCGRSGLNDCISESGVFWHAKTAVRLADVDVPSAESARCDAERQRGFRAKVRLRELLDAGPFDLVLSDSGDREQAGAKLRVAMRGGKSIGDQLVSEGLAQPKDGNFADWCP